MNPRPSISRRTVLRGLGAAVALPFLESLTPSRLTALARAGTAAGAGKAPVRMGILYMANGVNVNQWTPKGRGKDFELSPTLAPLADYKNDLLVFTELWNQAARNGDGHYVKSAGWLTGTTITKTTGKDIRSGAVSMDQLAAQRVGGQTPLPSLELGIEPVQTGVDDNVGYTLLYSSHISWATPTTPVGKEINPRLAFDRLFRTNPRAEGDNRSVLDLVADQANSVRSKVGGADKAKLDNYLDSVRSIEKRIEFNSRQRAEQHKMSPEQLTAIEGLERRITEFMDHPDRKKLAAGQRGGTPGADHQEHVRLMLDLMVMAFWSDSTRVASFMFGNAVSSRNFSFLPGVRGGHHEISHHKNKPDALEQYQRINQWHVEQYAYMLDQLKRIADGDDGRTLLDNSMILFGSCMRDGNAHDPHNLPLVVAGRAGGTLATGRHLVYEKNTPLCNLWTAMLDRAGAPVDRFGDSTEPLRGLDDPEFAGTAKA